MELIDSYEKLGEIIESNKMLLIYFGNNQCGVCVSLRPKIEELLNKYPKIKSVHVEANNSIEISAQYNIFTTPAVLVFIDGKETIREARFISIEDLSNKISRYYDMVFDE